MTNRALRASFVFVALAILSLSAAAASLDSSKFIGEWQFDREQSTDLSPWSRCQLIIAQDGDQLTITRNLRGGRRTFADVIPLDVTREVNLVPQGWWIGNRHIGAYSPHDAHQIIRAKTMDSGNILRLEKDLVLETSQGSRDINIISQYQISPDGQTLVVTDLRSTRPRPVVHVFNRVTAE
jgi:hypothetical protein